MVNDAPLQLLRSSNTKPLKSEKKTGLLTQEDTTSWKIFISYRCGWETVQRTFIFSRSIRD